MDQENINYLNNIAKKTFAYDEVRTDVIEYLLINKIKDMDLATNLFVIGFLWEANRQNEILTDEDLLVLLDAEDELDVDEFDEFREYFLDDDDQELTLKELLDKTVENFD